MMKLLLAYTLLVFYSTNTDAQSISSEVLSSNGDYFLNSNNSISWTLGEPFVETYTSSNVILTQGFHQKNNLFVSTIQENQISGFTLTIFPNPSVDFITIQLFDNSMSEITNESIVIIEIMDITGKQILHNEYAAVISVQNIVLNLQHLTSGKYLMNISTSDNSFKQIHSIEKIN